MANQVAVLLPGLALAPTASFHTDAQFDRFRAQAVIALTNVLAVLRGSVTQERVDEIDAMLEQFFDAYCDVLNRRARHNRVRCVYGWPVGHTRRWSFRFMIARVMIKGFPIGRDATTADNALRSLEDPSYWATLNDC